MRIPFLAGRDFSARDTANAARVAIVSDTFARQAWQTPANAVGRVITLETHEPATIVGVVADIRYFNTTEPYQALLYLPVAQHTPHRTTVHARVAGDGGTVAMLERALRSVDARLAIEAPTSLSARIDAVNAPERVMRWVAAGAGAIQLVLALMALWGLVAYASSGGPPNGAYAWPLAHRRRAWCTCRCDRLPC